MSGEVAECVVWCVLKDLGEGAENPAAMDGRLADWDPREHAGSLISTANLGRRSRNVV